MTGYTATCTRLGKDDRFSHNFPKSEDILRDALNQAARELLLAQSSDWPFIMTTGTMDSYAKSRITSHLIRFLKLERQIWENRIDVSWLRQLEATDNLFPHLDYHLFQNLEQTVAVEKDKLAEIT